MSETLSSLYDSAFADVASAQANMGHPIKQWRHLNNVVSSFEQVLALETSERSRDLVREQLREYRCLLRSLELSLMMVPEAEAAELQAKEFHERGDQKRAVQKYLIAVQQWLARTKEADVVPFQMACWKENAGRVLGIVETIEGVEKVVVKKHPSSNNLRYTPEEKNVLKESSYINGKLFMPWIESDGKSSEFFSEKKFVDPDGKLSLSVTQKQLFGSWCRATQLLGDNPQVIVHICPENITQEFVADCSFVSSLCIAAHYEKRFKRQLLSKIIYPQSQDGHPIFNPAGKYAVKLWYNGAPRCVIVDDRFPMTEEGHYLCSFSKDPNELWISIIEKAYMKLNGGYDFPGSISGIDLYALTGWIPEVHALVSGPRMWHKMLSAYHAGDVLMTASTGFLSTSQENQTGLVSCHAYAILHVCNVGDQKMLLLKNPWSRFRWKGKYSPFDAQHWTSAMCEALKYNRNHAMQQDDGMFWIDLDSLLGYFQSINLNWNPECFQHKCILHKAWPRNSSPKIDSINVGENPQYELEVSVGNGSGDAIVWVLLSRHITNKAQILSEETCDLLRLNVYDSQHRVYHPDAPLKEGVYSNNPHYLVTLELNPGETHRYVLVVSIFEKTAQVNYTLSAYGSAHCDKLQLREIPLRLPFHESIESEWSSSTAGGSSRYPTYTNNPMWNLKLTKSARLHIRLMAPKEFAVNIRIFKTKERLEFSDPSIKVACSGDYRHGFCVLEEDALDSAETYTIVVSTYEYNLVGPFILHVESTCQFLLAPIPQENHGMSHTAIVDDSWDSFSGAGGRKHEKYQENPKFVLEMPDNDGVCLIRLQQTTNGKIEWFGLNVCVFNSVMDWSSQLLCSHDGNYRALPCGVSTGKFKLEKGHKYMIVPSTYNPVQCDFKLIVHSTSTVAVRRLDSL